MTKADLIAKMAKDAGISKAAAEKALNSFTKAVTTALKKGEKIALIGFGTFSVTKRKARKGRNPQTGKEITIKARRSLNSKPARLLKKLYKFIIPVFRPLVEGSRFFTHRGLLCFVVQIKGL